MSKASVMRVLLTGPKSTAEILKFTGTSSADVSRTCSDLRHHGKIKRVDGGTGRGSRAIYALASDDVTFPAERRRHDERTLAEVRQDASGLTDSLRVERDPCTYCGVRADIGCKHRRAF